MDLSDIDMLKKLDEMDSSEFSESKKNGAGKTIVRKDSELNFDDSDDQDDDDLADLLYDDDDDLSSKNKNKSTSKVSELSSASKIIESPEKKLFGVSDGNTMFGKRKESTSGLNAFQKDGMFDKISGDSPKKTAVSPNKSASPMKKNVKNKLDLFFEEEEKYLGDLGMDQLDTMTSTSSFSNEKSITSPVKAKLVSKPSVDVEFDDDPLDSLDDMDKLSSPVKNKSVSYMDVLMKKDTPKPVLKKTNSMFDASPEKSLDKNDGDDMMVFGGYLPTGRSTSKSAGIRKQSVKFEDDVKNPASPQHKASPVKENDNSLVDKSMRPLRRRAEGLKSAPPGGRSGIFDNDLDDFLKSPMKKTDSIFSDSPKKEKSEFFQPQPSMEQNNKSGFSPSTGTSRRRDSSAKFLGLDRPPSDGPDTTPVDEKGEINRRATRHNPNGLTENEPSKGQYSWLLDSSAKEKTFTSEKKLPSTSNLSKQEMKPESTELNNSHLPEMSKFTENVLTHSTPQHAYGNPSSVSNQASVPQNVPQIVPSQNIERSPKSLLQSAMPSTAQTVPHNVPQVVPDNVHRVASHIAPQVALHNVPQSASPIVPHIALHNVPQVTEQHVANLVCQNDAKINELKALVSSLEFERDQLLKSKEEMIKSKEKDMKDFEETLKKQRKDIEETSERRMKSAQDEHQIELRKLNTELNLLRDDRKQLNEENRETVQKLDVIHDREVKKLKEFHSEAVTMLKRDHDDAISRMNRMRDQEIEAISSTQTQVKSLQALSDQLESRTSELAALQLKVEDRHHTAVKEKEALLAAKEKDLRTLEGRLQWQMEEGDHERTRLQQLILRLEKRLQIQTKDGEEERWNVQQLKVKLEMQLKFVEEEKKTMAESVEREKEKLRLSQNCLLQEQKTIVAQLAQERQQLNSEKLQLEQLAKRVREEEMRLTAKQLQEESNVQTQRRMLDEESEKLRLDKELLKQELLQVKSERNALEREQRQLRDEKQRFDDIKSELRRKTEEAEHLSLRAATEQEESHSKLIAARKIEADHHLRMNQFTEQMQAIMEKEKCLMLEQERIKEEARQFEKNRNEAICVNCKLAIGLPVTSLPPAIGAIQQQQQSNTRFGFAGHPHPSSIDPGMMVWYVTAQKDHDYLEEQLAFMKDLEERRKK